MRHTQPYATSNICVKIMNYTILHQRIACKLQQLQQRQTNTNNNNESKSREKNINFYVNRQHRTVTMFLIFSFVSMNLALGQTGKRSNVEQQQKYENGSPYS